MTINKRFPWYGWLGAGLLLAFWALNWLLPGLRTHWAFFPLWLGYCLLVDGLVLARKGTSLLARSRRRYLGLFVVSSFGWWLFEVINWRTQNWVYIGREHFSDWAYFALASLSFSTVMPAVFGTAELFGSFGWLQHDRPGPVIALTRTTLWGFFLTGWLMLALLAVWPRYFFAFVWLAIYFILEPLNHWRGQRTLAASTARGDWRPVLALWLGGLTCGFFWELWNYYSYPKWVYFVPFVDFAHIFEMPLLGYGGYLPFALELFALYHLTIGLFGHRAGDRYIQII